MRDRLRTLFIEASSLVNNVAGPLPAIYTIGVSDIDPFVLPENLPAEDQ